MTTKTIATKTDLNTNVIVITEGKIITIGKENLKTDIGTTNISKKKIKKKIVAIGNFIINKLIHLSWFINFLVN